MRLARQTGMFGEFALRLTNLSETNLTILAKPKRRWSRKGECQDDTSNPTNGALRPIDGEGAP
ncbi:MULTISPECIES: hypothetical protein [unclassified Gilliamella]|uniref:hypothetical protein n=1 Tax=unclassified Gilliamella TaxID=2685620 RepID=UPI0011463FFD|nr:hypothetical protein [Gilliamella apicola]